MAIAGDRPTRGFRLDVERSETGVLDTSPPWVYSGKIVRPDGGHDAQISVDSAGAVTVTLHPPAPGLAEKARLLMRAVCKECDAAQPPPRRVVRWRDA